MHPLTVKELGIDKQSDFEMLMELGGFPEPFLSGSQRQARRWKREYQRRVVNEDIPNLEQTQNLSMMELLLMRVPELVGSPLSVNALREDLGLAHKTVAKWIEILERMYLICRLSPFGSNKLRPVEKEHKHYHYNWALVEDSGARFENLIAGHLFKWMDFQQDYEGKNISLRYFRDVDRREIDFIITENDVPIYAIECKLKSQEISLHLKYFKQKFPEVQAIQVHIVGKDDYLSKEGIRVTSWKNLLTDFI